MLRGLSVGVASSHSDTAGLALLSPYPPRNRLGVAKSVRKGHCHPPPFVQFFFDSLMRRFAMLAVFTIVACLSAAAETPQSAVSAAGQEQPDALAAGAKIDRFVLSPDGHRTFYSDPAGELWMYDRAAKTTTLIAGGPVWDLSISANADAIAYTKSGAHRGEQFVFALSLDTRSGLGRGDERRLSSARGDVPSISPDGKLVAFARDDASGVGQSVVVAPIAGGAERTVASSLPSNVANIRWTPDGKAIFIGVNPPVACVPDWSCLLLATPELRQPSGSIRRVSALGGSVTIVTAAKGPSPGLSPDGTTLLFLDGATPAARKWTVAGPDGKPRASLTLPASQTPVAWLAGSTVVLISNERGAPLKVMTMDLSAARKN
jgi:hypothetical protein